jgi:hypothetical protein
LVDLSLEDGRRLELRLVSAFALAIAFFTVRTALAGLSRVGFLRASARTIPTTYKSFKINNLVRHNKTTPNCGLLLGEFSR